ncbi:N-acetylmuramoyl-L-alanine amidase family protein [Companilactobacillus mishanensis]|uniref:N-acetylmuramoyl-L-alanine amidase n=1 Tax=Companilactobacillus mishanensis TaxID=2486008 RepID=A0A5P0ZI31_9LACO|nr:peptidoglycan recognition family protein [Companilactobacillus mishanensis]MQS45230.1 N-acetylmuramoyl-L-alanine amidase [Companilactobacillus mishanensis]MQS52672.1 N-acetylmuramoyl-L-alanine amidase [Companilactobacillus mishanensis]
MFSKNKWLTGLVTSLALVGAGFVTSSIVSPAGVQVVKADSAINNYIANNGIQPVSIQYRTGTFDQQFPYENGVGKPEGVVIHETADPGATAENEVTFFNREWKNIQSYVHAFVDDTEIINISSADYGVWGCGPYGNAKFIQVEVCEVGTTDQFARSMANQAYYTAYRLVQYGLPDIPGETVISHHQVSQKFGGTDHVDPDGYFAKWGYDMNQFNDLVAKYYNQLKNDGGATNSTPGTNNNGGVSGSEGSVTVKNPNSYAVPLVAFQNDGTTKRSNRGLANNSGWYTDQQKSYNGHTYYRVSTNEWVEDTYSTFAGY